MATGHLYCAVLNRQISANCRTVKTTENFRKTTGCLHLRQTGDIPETFIFFTVLLVLLVT